MTLDKEKLSGFLDGELSAEETREIEKALETDTNLQAELELLMASDGEAKKQYNDQLSEPVPFALAAAIQNAPLATPSAAPQKKKYFGSFVAAAAALALIVGGTGGYFIGAGTNAQVTVAGGWLSDIADYHAVYSAQGRHLVEVAADEPDHIEQWLTASVGVDVQIPDLKEYGLTFRGARLLVAAGKPVAQLTFTDASGKVVALCLIASDKALDGFNTRTLGGFDMVSWSGNNTNFVVVGDEGQKDLVEIANTAAREI